MIGLSCSGSLETSPVRYIYQDQCPKAADISDNSIRVLQRTLPGKLINISKKSPGTGLDPADFLIGLSAAGPLEELRNCYIYRKEESMTQWRKCEVFKGLWINLDLGLIKKGDVFRLFEADGTPVTDGQGRTEFTALKDAVPCEPKSNFSVEVRK